MTKHTKPGRNDGIPPSSTTTPPTGQDSEAHDKSKRAEAEDAKATKFDGNPAPKGAERDALKPKDDTPAVLEKKSGPRTGKASSQ